MDCVDLLAKEEEFKKLNQQLERKTESLMKQIELQMQKQDIFTDFSSLTLSPGHTSTNKSRHSCSSSNSTPEKTPVKLSNVLKNRKDTKHIQGLNEINDETAEDFKKRNINGTKPTRIQCDCCPASRKERIAEDLEFLYAFVTVNVQENVLPQSFVKDKPTVESVCKFLANKVKLMQEQIEKLQMTINKKASQCEVHLTHQAELESERMSLMTTCNSLRAAAESARSKCHVLQKKLDEKDRLYVEQRTSADKLSVEVKRLRSKSAGVEARSAMQEDTVQGLRHQLDCMKRTEKELRDASRTLSSQHEEAVKQFQSQISHLKQHNRKQRSLITNLKKQRALLTSSTIVECVDRDYNKLLEQAFQ